MSILFSIAPHLVSAFPTIATPVVVALKGYKFTLTLRYRHLEQERATTIKRAIEKRTHESSKIRRALTLLGVIYI